MTNMVKVKFLEGPCIGTANKFHYDSISKIAEGAGQKDSPAAAATGAAAVASPLAAAFSASAVVVAIGSEDKPVDIEKDLAAMLDAKEAAELFSEFGTLS